MAQNLPAPRKSQVTSKTASISATHVPGTSVPQTGPYRWPERISIGPQIGFAAALVLGCITWTVARTTLPADAVVPVVSSLVLVMAGLFALIAWRQRFADANNVSYLDVAGVLTLIGICTAATIDPEQMVRLVQDSQSTGPTYRLSSAD